MTLPPSRPAAPLTEGFVDRFEDRRLIGWARRVGSDEAVTVNVRVAGRLASSGLADRYRGDLRSAGKGHGRHAFEIPLPAMAPIDLRVETDDGTPIPMSPALQWAVHDLCAGLDAGGEGLGAEDAPGGPIVWLDLSDLMFYLGHHKTVSGIQRVQCEIVRVVAAMGRPSIRFCWTTPDCHEYYEMSGPMMRELLVKIDGNAQIPLPDWIAYIGMLSDPPGRRPAAIRPGSMVFVLGAFWVYPRIPSLLTSLHGRGVRIAVFIYDLIPLHHPEYCDPSLARSFSTAFSLMSQIADLIFTISRYTASEVARFYQQLGQPPRPIVPALLAHEPPPAPSNVDAGESPLPVFIGGPYVLCVCTIEARKNHVFLLRIWQELLRRHGPANVPKLVLVGRRGWRVDPVFAMLEATRNLDRHVLVLHDADDRELAALYRRCLFTVFPSLVEGWGLPVGESLMHGKVCITSRTSSIPEVGGEFAVYVDPANLAEGVQITETFIFDHDRRARMEEFIRTRFEPRRWTDVAALLFGEIGSFLRSRPEDAGPAPLVRLVPGRALRVRYPQTVDSLAGIQLQRPFGSLVLVAGWRPADAHGAWMNAQTALLAFGLDIGRGAPPERVRVYLHLALAPGARGLGLELASACGAARTVHLDDDADVRVLTLDCMPLGGPDDPMVRITLRLDGSMALPDEAAGYGVGLRTIAVACDPIQRLDVVEELLFLMSASRPH